MRQRKLLILLVLAGSLCFHCDRAVEPFDPDEEPRAPDLGRIFPDSGGAPSGQSSGAGMAGAGRSALPEPPDAKPARGNLAAEPIRGTVEISPTLADAQPDRGVLFLIARTQPSGPPLAVLRVSAPRFPHAFEIGQQNVMIPTLRFEGAIRLSARLDADGNAMTKQPGDLVGEIGETLAPGASGATLVLDGRI